MEGIKRSGYGCENSEVYEERNWDVEMDRKASKKMDCHNRAFLQEERVQSLVARWLSSAALVRAGISITYGPEDIASNLLRPTRGQKILAPV